jgi:hypothetical protein
MSTTKDPERPQTAEPPDATGRAEARRSLHYVPSHGTDRTCADGGCNTKLSRYNKSKWCWVHDPAGR